MTELKRYVIQEHCPASGVIHWDIMLEGEGVLSTWRLTEKPAKGTFEIDAIKIFDHALRFLEYEGPVNDGKGSVKIVDRGHFTVRKGDAVNLAVDLEGELLRGRFEFKRVFGEAYCFAKVK